MEVNVRWRPSGGRGEYEHVPADILLNRRIAIAMPGSPPSRIFTDARGFMRDGKPRLRRDDPNDRAVLNIAPLVAALALLPDPRREDKGVLELPLRDKNYVISSITFEVTHEGSDIAICMPRRLQILHDTSTIDVFQRISRVWGFLSQNGLPNDLAPLAKSYIDFVNNGISDVSIRDISNGLIKWLDNDDRTTELIGEPSDEVIVESHDIPINAIIGSLTADETRRRLVSHYKIDRNPKIRRIKLSHFKSQHSSIHCENCGFSFEKQYGERGKDFIEVHHKRPLATLLPNEVTTLSDLILLCANCHRMIHRKPPPLTPEELKAISKFD